MGEIANVICIAYMSFRVIFLRRYSSTKSFIWSWESLGSIWFAVLGRNLFDISSIIHLQPILTQTPFLAPLPSFFYSHHIELEACPLMSIIFPP